MALARDEPRRRHRRRIGGLILLTGLLGFANFHHSVETSGYRTFEHDPLASPQSDQNDAPPIPSPTPEQIDRNFFQPPPTPRTPREEPNRPELDRRDSGRPAPDPRDRPDRPIN
jgi:hypothetical protein